MKQSVYQIFRNVWSLTGITSLVLIFAFIFSGIILPQKAEADTINAASCSYAHVQAAINSAEDGDTIVIPAGTCTWTSNIVWEDVPDNITIMGAGTDVVGGGDQTVIIDNFSGASPLLEFDLSPTGVFRMTGITFESNPSGTGSIKDGGTVRLNGPATVRLDHMHFNMDSSVNYKFLVIGTGVFGVLHQSIIDLHGTNAIYLYNGRVDDDSDDTQGNLEWSLPTNFGGPDYFYIEDNVVNGNTGWTVYDSRLIDGFSAAKVVVRFNTVSQATLAETHATGHAFDDRGLRSQEIYGNVVTSSLVEDPNFTAVDMGSGTTLAWGNSWDNVYKNIFIIKTTRADNGTYNQQSVPNGWGYCGTDFNGTGSAWDGNQDTTTGYPCVDQPGRGQGDLITGEFPNKVNSTTGTVAWPNQELEPIYIWNNTGSIVSGWGGNTYSNSSGGRVVANRDYYPQVSGVQSSPTSPFNGTQGTGWGTLANRPTTCTSGVGYFATDQGNWNQTTSNPYGVQQNGSDGTLYKCTSTNTWTEYYTPYTYPHPLRLGEEPETYTIGGSISGLDGTVVLQNNGGDDLSRSENDEFTFATPLLEDDEYEVTVLTQPDGQTCSVSNGSGTVGTSDVTNVSVSCEDDEEEDETPPTVTAFTIPATHDELEVPINTFTATDNVGVTGYLVTESATTPSAGNPNWDESPWTSFTFATEGAKTLYAWAKDAEDNISTSVSDTVTITLPPATYSIGGTVSGLNLDFPLQNNSVDTIVITDDGPFTFPTELEEGEDYDVTIPTQPEDQTCLVSNGSGTVGTSNVTDILIVCEDNVDETPPVVTVFTIPATHDELEVPINTFTATDDVEVTGYLVTESASTPAVDNPNWDESPWTSFTFASEGAKTLYAWAKDEAGNISDSVSDTVTITLPDETAPVVTAFVIPATHDELEVPINTFTATDAFGVTGYLVTESASTPDVDDPNWDESPWTSYTFDSEGSKTLYAWAKDDAGNISTSLDDSVTITLPDITPPTVTAFTIPATHDELEVPISNFTATDAFGVTGYLVTESASTPSLANPNWSGSAWTSFTFASEGAKTLYAWARDAAGNISNSVSDTVTITLPEPETYSIGGSISGLDGTVVLQNNGGDNLSRSVNGAFTFSTELEEDEEYDVTVFNQPEGQTCLVSNASGTVGTSNITNVSVTCTNDPDETAPTVTAFDIPATHGDLDVPINTFTATDNIGVTGYLVTESPSTPSEDDPDWAGSAWTSFNFASEGSKTLYAWAKDAAGNVSTSLSDTVTITLPDDPTYSIGGSISGLDGTVVLQNNGGDDLSRSANGVFTFNTELEEDEDYDVTILTQPDDQTCVVSNGSGTVGSANITNVSVVCEDDAPPGDDDDDDDDDGDDDDGSVGGNDNDDNDNESSGRRRSTKRRSVPGVIRENVTSAVTDVVKVAQIIFTRNLGLGAVGDDVLGLQKFLNKHGYAVSLSGFGSDGNETNYFGLLTRSALARFQSANNIVPAEGFLGPITRAFIERMQKMNNANLGGL